MAVGDAVVDLADAANNGTLTAQPGSGVEWLVHTLMSESGAAMEVYLSEDSGSTYYLVDSLAGGSAHNLTYRLTNTFVMQLKNVSGGTNMIGYQGVVTK